MAKAKKATLVCRPCAYGVSVSDIGSAVVECWQCGMELVPAEPAAARKLIAAKKARPAQRAAPGKKAAPRRPAAKKPAAKKAAPGKKK